MSSAVAETNHPEVVLESIGTRMFNCIAGNFPICSASDEFYYFPQVTLSEQRWSAWDDFSADAVDEIAGKLSAWETELARAWSASPDFETHTDVALLVNTARTLREQLVDVRLHETQPTFYLTVASIGLAEAMESLDPDAWPGRILGLPAFLDRAARGLKRVPILHRDLGLEMSAQVRDWLISLKNLWPGLDPVLEALDRFEEKLVRVPTQEDYRLPDELVERIIKDHMGCGVGTKETLAEHELEMERALRSLGEEAHRLGHEGSWKRAWETIPRMPVPEGGVMELFRNEITRLERLCTELGLIRDDLACSCPVRVAHVPSSLSAIRSGDAYSSRPGHPPAGGTFFILGGGRSRISHEGCHPVYRMTAAHETYPGHHLLDVSRWSLGRWLRRPIERPLFYEGWACFAEDFLERIGYFAEPWDRMILARRRLRHAVRGKVDLLIQTRQMEIADGAAELERVGFSRKQALSTLRKYTLRPGYQVCYASGLRRFRFLFDRYGEGDIADFARTVLGQGEIGFGDLERALGDRITLAPSE